MIEAPSHWVRWIEAGLLSSRLKLIQCQVGGSWYDAELVEADAMPSWLKLVGCYSWGWHDARLAEVGRIPSWLMPS